MSVRPTALRPLAFGEVLDVAIKICIRHWRVLVPITLALWLPLAFVTQLIGITSRSSTSNSGLGSSSFGSTSTVSQSDLLATLGATAAGVVIALIGTTIVTGALFRAIGDGYLGGHPTIGSSLRYAARRVPSLLWVTFLTVLGSFFGALLCIVPGVWFAIATEVAVPALLTEDVRGAAAVRRSIGLIRTSWWRVFGLVIVSQLLVSIVQGALVGAVSFAINGQGDAVELLGGTIVQAAAYSVTLPFATAVTAVIYFDRRVRTEGFDLEMLAVALDGQIGIDAAPPAPLLPAPPPAPAPPAADPGEPRPSDAPEW